MSVREARWFVAETLRHDPLEPVNGSSVPEAGDQDGLLHAAALVTSELATNAVVHAGTEFEVSVDVGDRVVIAVTDHSPTLPHRRDADVTDLGGRGLLLVDQCTSAWGVDRFSGGKRVWGVVASLSGASVAC